MFSGCTGLTDVVFLNGASEIGESAFENCTSLTNVVIPNSVTSIGECAFKGCKSLVNIAIPENVKEVRMETFSGCINLETVSLPDNVTYIGSNAFRGCEVLSNIVMPSNLTKIGDYAFYSCRKLKNVTLYNKITEIGKRAFAYCEGLAEVVFNAGRVVSMDYAFYGASVPKLTIGNNVEYIPSYAFKGCSGFECVTIPQKVKSIGYDAFAGCRDLKEVIYNAVSCEDYDVTNYTGSEAFRECSSLTKLTIGEGVKNIPKGLFYECGGLMSVVIPKSVEEIGDYAFYDCYNIRSMTSQNPTPPQCGEKAFYGIKVEACPLYVPTESVSLYQTAYGWRDFWNIYGKEFSGIENLTIDEKEFSIEYYNLQGVKVENPDNGVYIKKQGSRMTKVVM